jgi:putative tryptophan/tyrosine transport system substrate-binding protein
MRRREFITSFGSSVVAWPLTARAQQAAPSPNAHLVAAFRQGLSESGYVEGRNVAFEFRWAEGRYNELPALAADLVRRRVAVIFGGAPPAARAAKAATATIPIVFTSGDDPVKSGLVASLNRPGGNVTGVAILTGQIGSKLLGLLRDLVPDAAVVAVLVNPTFRYAEQSSDLQAAARTLGLQLHVLLASTERDIDTAFETLAGLKADALVVGADSFFLSRSDKIVALAARLALPAIYQSREYAAAGGLVTYGTSLADSYRLAGIYVGRILKGDKPADLPVLQPTKFELVINLKTAKALGLAIPSGVMAIADEVIE